MSGPHGVSTHPDVPMAFWADELAVMLDLQPWSEPLEPQHYRPGKWPLSERIKRCMEKLGPLAASQIVHYCLTLQEAENFQRWLDDSEEGE